MASFGEKLDIRILAFDYLDVDPRALIGRRIKQYAFSAGKANLPSLQLITDRLAFSINYSALRTNITACLILVRADPESAAF